MTTARGRQVGLAAVLYQCEPFTARQRRKRRHVCGLAVQVNWKHSGSAISDRTLSGRGIERQPFGIDVRKDWMCAGHDNGHRRIRGR